jgi:hypothetical protein
MVSTDAVWLQLTTEVGNGLSMRTGILAQWSFPAASPWRQMVEGTVVIGVWEGSRCWLGDGVVLGRAWRAHKTSVARHIANGVADSTHPHPCNPPNR